jgi:hypothetical protein
MTAPLIASPRSASQNGHQSPRSTPPIRQRNVTRIAIGVVILALSTLGVVGLRSEASATRPVLVVTRTVSSGEPIRRGDVRAIQVPTATSADLVPAADLDLIVGRTARTTLVDGSLLSPGQITDAMARSGTAMVGATLKDGQFPTTLRVGDRVLAVSTSDGATGGDTGAPRSTRGVVIDIVEQTTDSPGTVVSLRVPLDDAPAVAAAGGAGHVSLVSVEP